MFKTVVIPQILDFYCYLSLVAKAQIIFMFISTITVKCGFVVAFSITFLTVLYGSNHVLLFYHNHSKIVQCCVF